MYHSTDLYCGTWWGAKNLKLRLICSLFVLLLPIPPFIVIKQVKLRN